MRAIVLVTALLAGVAAAQAAPPIDGSTPLKCAIKNVMICNESGGCVAGTAASANLPGVLEVDPGQRRIGGARSGRTVKITSMGRGGGRLIFHGDEIEMLGVAWDLVVVEASGAMSAAILQRGDGVLLFGSCAS